MSAVPTFCAGCGGNADTILCDTCLTKHECEKWNPCQARNCENPCPLRYCTGCHANHKRPFKQCLTPDCYEDTKVDYCPDCAWKNSWNSCESCDVVCPKRFCDDCFSNLNACKGCGRNSRQGSIYCQRCEHTAWGVCSRCSSETPLPNICLPCQDQGNPCHASRTDMCFCIDVSTYCAGCGVNTENVLCDACVTKHGTEQWKPCQARNCENPCPLRYCTGCHVSQKSPFKPCWTPGCDFETKFDYCRDCNWKSTWKPCEGCDVVCPKRFCEECFIILGICDGCGRNSRRGSAFCDQCSHAKWRACNRCGSDTPIQGVCLCCRNEGKEEGEKINACQQCGADSNQRFCKDCWTTPQHCAKCGWIHHVNKAHVCRPLRECKGVGCKKMTTKQLCLACFDAMGQYICNRS